ncbi:MAG: ABC transporter ATP-binding protein, partial [Planctomycetaceae bacterium]
LAQKVVRKRSKAVAKEKSDFLLKKVGIHDKSHAYPGQLSGGQQQRVAIARALVTDPSILMGDEPTGNLDSKTSREVIELFRKLNEEQGITVILVTHDLNVARNARRMLVLRDGRIVTDTTDYEEAFHVLHTAEDETAEDSVAEDQTPAAEEAD